MTNCVVYCRVSSDAQATDIKTSLDDQEMRGRAKAEELKLQVWRVARDSGSAWVLDKRSKFQAILNDARAGKFGVLIVDRMNRFSRSEDLAEPLLVLHELKELGVRVEFSDRQYADGLLGQAMQLLDLFGSAKEQESRRKASWAGRVGRATKLGRPTPNGRKPYGYIWKDAKPGELKRSELLKDPGTARQVTERIWNYFLHYTPTLKKPRPTVRALAVQLNAEHIPPPAVYHGILGKTGKRKNIWTRATIVKILANGIYWGEPKPALSESKYPDLQAPVPIKAYGPTYVTPEEATRVHARYWA